MKSRFPIFALTFLVLSTSLQAAETLYPRECCPLTCEPVADAALLVSDPTGRQKTLLITRHGKVPVPDDLQLRVSPDGRMHACIGYDAFGDREVKCVLAPLAM